MANEELGIADIIVGGATSTPTVEQSRRKTQGIMGRAMPEEPTPTKAEDLLPSYISQYIETIRNERGAMDYLKETTDVTRLDDYEIGLDEQAQRMIDSAEAQYSYPTDSEEAPLYKYITQGEAESYDTVSMLSKVQPSKPITEMTVAEAIAFQEQMKAAGSQSTALGQFQIISPTMKQLIKEGAISEQQIFNEETQNAAFEHLLNKRGYADFKERMSSATNEEEKRKAAEAFQLNLSKEFASVPIPYDLPNRGLKKGDSYYKGKTNAPNEAKYSSETFLQMLMRQKV